MINLKNRISGRVTELLCFTPTTRRFPRRTSNPGLCDRLGVDGSSRSRTPAFVTRPDPNRGALAENHVHHQPHPCRESDDPMKSAYPRARRLVGQVIEPI